jgi:hypothetical protein
MADQPREECRPTEREIAVEHQRMCVQHPHQPHVHEERLRGRLERGQRGMHVWAVSHYDYYQVMFGTELDEVNNPGRAHRERSRLR